MEGTEGGGGLNVNSIILRGKKKPKMKNSLD